MCCSLFCDIDPLASTVGVTAQSLQQLVQRCHLFDNHLSLDRLNSIFLTAGEHQHVCLHMHVRFFCMEGSGR